MGNIEGWFATPVYYADIRTARINEEIESYLTNSPMHSALDTWNDDVDTTYTSGKTDNTLMDTCPTFKSAVLANAQEFLMGINYFGAELEITESWANQTARGQYQNAHEHGTSADISGAYYHKSIGEKKQGQLVFADPSLAARISKPMGQQSHTAQYTAHAGRLILFPSF